MKRTRILAALLAASTLLSLGVAQSASSAVMPTAEADLRALNANEVSDFMSADTKALDRLWADSFVVTNPLNQLVSKPQVLGMVSSGVLRFKSYERTVEYVRTYGDTAVVAGRETAIWAGKFPLAGKVYHLRFTAVWVHADGAWRQVARHANIVPDR